MFLSKTDFQLFRDSPKHLWAKAHHQLKEEPFSAYDRFITQQGYEFEKLVVDYSREQPRDGDQIFVSQRTWKAARCSARSDIVLVNEVDRTVELYEIKASTSVKPDYLWDVAFQIWVIEQTGYRVTSAYVVHVNRNYVRRGELNTTEMIRRQSVLPRIANQLKEVPNMVKEAWRIMELPSAELIPSCYRPSTCPCPQLCHPNLPAYSIYQLPRLGQKKIDQLRQHGLLAVADIPTVFPLTPLQEKAVKLAKLGTYVDDYRLSKELAKLQYPLYFLDYETFSPVIPLWDGYRPWQHFVFQYSLHWLNSPDSELQHREHVETSAESNAVLVAQLVQDIGPTGSVVVWNKQFEASRNRELADLFPEQAKALHSINHRIYDLMEIFRQQVYYDLNFHGSSSIKKVLPVLAPQFSYKKLAIQDGGMAMEGWHQAVFGSLTDVAKAQIITNLLAYCQLDTLAMYEIWRFLTAYRPR